MGDILINFERLVFGWVGVLKLHKSEIDFPHPELCEICLYEVDLIEDFIEHGVSADVVERLSVFVEHYDSLVLLLGEDDSSIAAATIGIEEALELLQFGLFGDVR